MIKRWYLANIELIERIFGQVSYDDLGFSWIRIHRFKLPPVYKKSHTTLFIRTPGDNIENYVDYNFYLDKDLSRKDNLPLEHIFDGPGYNDLAHKNYARLSFHLESFRPTYDVINGDNLVDICQAVYNFLAQRKGV